MNLVTILGILVLYWGPIMLFGSWISRRTARETARRIMGGT